jgi:hypothetical protein
MAQPEEHPLQHVHDTLVQAYRQLEFYCQVYEEYRQEVLQTEFPTKALAEEAQSHLLQQRTLLDDLAENLDKMITCADAMGQEVWAHLKRAWMDRLDADLAQLGRESREGPE